MHEPQVSRGYLLSLRVALGCLMISIWTLTR